jgi:hypothetical protein
MHVASHDLFNMKLRTCLDTGFSSCVESYIIHLVADHISGDILFWVCLDASSK